ncbi:MAG TPA: hypothetical protein VFV78_00780 [Vicinamibacterales bacterium]|nr:hypothetical protein [Vicinamibacterales bacterium]
MLWSGAGAQQSSFQDLFARYRGADAEAALREFATWSSRRYEAEAAPTAAQRADPWTAAALALFYLETDFRRLSIRKDIETNQSDAAAKPFEVGVSLVLWGQRLLADAVLPTIRQSGDLRLAAFCRDWLIVRHSALPFAIQGESAQESWKDLAERYFFDDPRMATTLGISSATDMGPFAFGGRLELGENGPVAGGKISFGGHIYFASIARDAELAFRRALQADATLVEARLRLGRLYEVIGRLNESQTELVRAERDATRGNDRVTAYLASLFLGELHDNAGRIAESEASYRSAIAGYPNGMAARFALGDALLRWGRADEAWETIRTALGPETRTALRDPWAVYKSFRYWQFGPMLASMRQLVSHSPLGTQSSGLEHTLVDSSGLQLETTLHPASIPVFKGGIEGIRVDALVTDDDGAVEGLAVDDFIVTDNQIRQRITQSTTAGSLSLAVVLDASASLSGPDGIAYLKTATEATLRGLTDVDRIAVVSAADRVHLLSNLELKGEAFRTALSASRPRIDDFTALWDAVLAGSSLVVNAPGRPIVLVVSDGSDNVSWFPRDRTMERLNRRALTVDTVTIPAWLDHRMWDFAYGDFNLHDPAVATGGVAFDVQDRELAAKLAARFETLRHSYILFYTPERTVPQKDGWHDIKVSLRPGLKGKVQARPGYYELKRR